MGANYTSVLEARLLYVRIGIGLLYVRIGISWSHYEITVFVGNGQPAVKAGC